MLTRRQANTGLLATAAVAAPALATAEQANAITLPSPRKDGGEPLLRALNLRRSTREYSDRKLQPQVLSDMLWAAFGINRPGGDRTAPYWRHVMVIDVYAAMEDGVWLYEPETHTLRPHLAEDIRAATGLQEFVGTAPLNLVYVAHWRPHDQCYCPRIGGSMPLPIDTGFIRATECLILFCASEGLGSVFRGAVDYAKLNRLMRLPEQQFVTFAQTVGYPRG